MNIQIQQTYLRGTDVFLQYFCGPLSGVVLTNDGPRPSKSKPLQQKARVLGNTTGSSCAQGKDITGSASQTPEMSKTSRVCSLVSFGLQ